MSPFVELRVEDWQEIHPLIHDLSGYIFRGQSNAQWPLSTSLERCFEGYHPAFSVFTENREHWTLHEFKRKSHLYSSYQPPEDDKAEWLTIMQHYGCPTRLLDFTYSGYAAANFAVLDTKTDGAIWAVDWRTMRDNLHAQFKLEYKPGETLRDEMNQYHLALANRFIASRSREGSPASAIPFEPKKLTERIARQQGLFVMPTNARLPFMTNLWAAYSQDTTTNENPTRIEIADLRKSLEDYDRPRVIKMVLARDQQEAALKNLCQMNITAETLFGGLDGLARSLVQTVIRGL